MDIHAINSILDVTSQDIAYFKRGEMSPAVRERLKKAERGCNRSLYIIFFVCIVIVVGLYFLTNGDMSTFIATAAIPALLAIGSLVLLLFARNATTNETASVIHSTSGPAKLTVTRDDGSKRYTLLVGKIDFSLDRSLFEAIPEGADITAYYQVLGPRTNKLLGVSSNE